MMHKAWRSTEEMPYCFSRSSIKFQGNTGWKMDDLNPVWDYQVGRSYQIPQICLVYLNVDTFVNQFLSPCYLRLVGLTEVIVDLVPGWIHQQEYDWWPWVYT